MVNGMNYFGASDMVRFLDELLHESLPATINLVGSYIHSNATQIVNFDD